MAERSPRAEAEALAATPAATAEALAAPAVQPAERGAAEARTREGWLEAQEGRQEARRAVAGAAQAPQAQAVLRGQLAPRQALLSTHA